MQTTDVKPAQVEAMRISVKEGKQEIGRAFLYIIYNNLHPGAYAYLEDVFVEEKFRREGVGIKILRTAQEEAMNRGCYKLVATSRFSRRDVHEFYERFGFKRHGVEFRMDL